MGKLEENKKQKKEALLNAAYDLFIQKGITKTTISEIVDHAGIAKGTFYLYFKDKYDICNHLVLYKINEVFADARETLKFQNIHSFKEQVIFVVDHSIEILEKDPALLAFVSKNLTHSIFSRHSEETSSCSSFCLDFLSDEQQAYAKPELMLFTIFELVNSTCYSCILHGKPVSMKEYRPYLYKAIDAIMKSFQISSDDFSPQ